MKKIFTLAIAVFALNNANALEYGPFKKFFELGQVEFFRSAGYFEERLSDYEVTVLNNFGVSVCVIPNLTLVRNGRNEFEQDSYLLPAGTMVNLGHYGAEELGKSWHVKWEYLVTKNLARCKR